MIGMGLVTLMTLEQNPVGATSAVKLTRWSTSTAHVSVLEDDDGFVVIWTPIKYRSDG